MAENRPVSDRAELEEVLNLLERQFRPTFDTSDSDFSDLLARFPADQPLMLVAIAEGQPVGGAWRSATTMAG